MHRGNYDDLVFGPSSQVVPNAMQVAIAELTNLERKSWRGRTGKRSPGITSASQAGRSRPFGMEESLLVHYRERRNELSLAG
jgi:hypothetical protein